MPEREKGPDRASPTPPRPEGDGDLMAEFRSALRRVVAAQTESFEDLSLHEQYERMLAFLEYFYPLLGREMVLSRRLQAPTGEPLEVSRNEIRLAVSQEGEEETIFLSLDQKRMFAYLVTLTEARISQGINPWITSRSLASHTSPFYSKDQLYQHCLQLLGEIGLLEVSRKWGYRLACSLEKAREVLESPEIDQALAVADFETWFPEEYPDWILAEERHLRLLQAISDQCQAAPDPQTFLARKVLEEVTGLSREAIYDQLGELANSGVVAKAGKRYQVGDFRQDFIAHVLASSQKPIVLDVRVAGAPPPLPELDITAQARMIKRITEADFDFPRASWIGQGVEVEEVVNLDDAGLLVLINRILEADLRRTAIINVEAPGSVYSGMFPDQKTLGRPIILGVLEFLGLGPKELGDLPKGPPTLAAALLELENSAGTLQNQFLVAEMKARVASVIFGQIVLPDPEMEFTWKDLMVALEAARLPVVEVPVEEVAPSAPIAPLPAVLKPIAIPREEPEEVVSPIKDGLLALMSGPFDKEVRMATGQEALFLKPLPPEATFVYHRSLSRMEDSIPERDLLGLGLLLRGERDHHPRFTPAGALVAALFFKQVIRSRAGRLGKGQSGALEVTAIHTAHLIASRLGREIGEKERTYLEACLANLDETNLLCPCPQCQKAD